MAEVSIDTLDTGDIHQRADVGRQLAKVGSPDQIPRLLRAAREDKSPGVRLYAVGAAADILSRYRVGAGAKELDEQQRTDLLAEVRKVDPGKNAGIFSVLANLGHPKTLRPILIGLRDPRLDVRTGASVGIYRYCISWEAADHKEVRAALGELIEDPRVRPDVRANLVRLCACCGWQEVRPVLESFLERGDQVAVAAEQALKWLEASAGTEGFEGIWWSNGADAGEIRPDAGPIRWMALGGGAGVVGELDALKPMRWNATNANTLVVRGKRKGRAVRRMMIARDGGNDRKPAMQESGITWYQATPAEALQVATRILELHAEQKLGLDEELSVALIGALSAAMGPKADGEQMALRLLVTAGRHQEALDRIEALLVAKKPPVELMFYKGEALSGLGDAEGAQKAWAAFAKKSPKKSPLLPLAQARLGTS